MYIVAITGGIGSGKSEVANQFAQLGVPIVDTDVIAHALTAAGSPMIVRIADLFGQDVLNEDNSLNRSSLRAKVLSNPAERIKLEGLLHPAIYDHALAQLEDNERKLNPSYQILVIPLLFENNRYQNVVNKILVIDCNEATQISRAMTRSKLSEQEVKAIMQAQTTRATRLSGADEVIENNGSLSQLSEKVIQMHNKIIKTCLVSK